MMDIFATNAKTGDYKLHHKFYKFESISTQVVSVN